MRHYQAKELENPNTEEGTGIYHFTVTHNGRTHVTGHCAKKKCRHKSIEEASDCYREYLLDTTYREYEYGKGFFDRKCRVCKEITFGGAKIGLGIPSEYPLCKKHLNKETLRKYLGFGTPLEMYSSY